MIDLAALARGSLQPWLSDPPDGLRPDQGVIGVSIGYDEAFVGLVDRTWTPHERGSVEHSTVIAERLREARRGLGDRAGADRSSDWNLEGAVTEWRRISAQRPEGFRSPLRIDVTVALGAARDFAASGERVAPSLGTFSTDAAASRDEPGFTDGLPVYVRPSRRARLQLAGSGGRLGASPRSNRWGTLGGFLRSPAGELYAMTAGHVLPTIGSGVVATPAFASGIAAARLAMQTASHWSQRLGAESGTTRHSSRPQELGRGQCQFQITRATTGLDYALAAWPDDSARRLQAAPVVELGEVSQVLKARFVGARSGRVDVRVTRYSVWHAYDLNAAGTQVACIADCLEVALDQRQYVRTDVSRGGDSGAWLVCDDANGPRWLGLLVGGDGDRTGIVPAYRIRNELSSTFGAMTSMV